MLNSKVKTYSRPLFFVKQTFEILAAEQSHFFDPILPLETY